jgi:glycine cleavage system H protein
MSTTKYTEDHEWIRLDEDNEAVIGITDYAQEQLGELVYIEMPDLESTVTQGDDCAVVESVKAAGDVKSPATGVVLAHNEALEDNPELVNENAMGEGWIFRIKLEDAAELDALMDEAAYEAYINSLS